MNFLHLFFVCVLSLCMISKPETLDDLALKYGTDKNSLFHGYTKIYEKYFSPLKDKPLKFLEIGFCSGCSARMWEDYFSNAQLFYIDINPGAHQFLRDFKRTHLHIANQEDPKALAEFIKKVGGNFDIIIDDGGHTMNQQITSFKVLFPHVKSGGIYIIEDLHTSYHKYVPDYIQYISANQPTAVEFLQDLIHSVNGIGARTTWANFDKCSPETLMQLSAYEKDIESMHFYCSMCFIFKR